jgi:hypothetical protein
MKKTTPALSVTNRSKAGVLEDWSNGVADFAGVASGYHGQAGVEKNGSVGAEKNWSIGVSE